MFANWLETLLARRYGRVRLALTGTLLAGDLALVHRPGDAVAWALVLAVCCLYVLAARWPLGGVCALAVALGVAELAAPGVLMPVKVIVGIALFELGVRRPGVQLALGGALFMLGAAVGWLIEPVDATSLYRVSVFLAVPLLAGAYVRSARTVAAQSRVRAAEQERTAIARELHDLVAHHVSSMVLRIGVARHVLPTDTDPRVSEILNDLHSTSKAAMDDLSHLVTVLREPAAAVTAPLPAALEDVLCHGRGIGLTIDASITPDLQRLDTVRGVAVLRFVQEGLANVARHAGPTAAVKLTIEAVDRLLHLQLTDDGGKADGPSLDAAQGAGMGLDGMRERLEILGGRLGAGPEGSGWRLTASLPLPEPSP
ncbi:hypothetical protein GCM10010411_90040 [Actinomadura fulvescens]|uniref:histidine kinase n=1 Tax=Actinomadura fulvescens TaxID=46160 RepID=A0ABP6DAY0_9ACTN